MAKQQWPATFDRRAPWSGQARRCVALALAAIMIMPVAVGAQTVEPLGSSIMPDILRGSTASPPPRVEPAAGPTSEALDGQALARNRFWMVNEERGKLVACRLVNTSEVGGQYIRCTERRLPRGARQRN